MRVLNLLKQIYRTTYYKGYKYNSGKGVWGPHEGGRMRIALMILINFHFWILALSYDFFYDFHVYITDENNKIIGLLYSATTITVIIKIAKYFFPEEKGKQIVEEYKVLEPLELQRRSLIATIYMCFWLVFFVAIVVI